MHFDFVGSLNYFFWTCITTSIFFLQVLLRPIVAQFVLEPPSSSLSHVPTVQEMDDSLVLCLGQMAVTAKSDVLWKPLNHEVCIFFSVVIFVLFSFCCI